MIDFGSHAPVLVSPFQARHNYRYIVAAIDHEPDPGKTCGTVRGGNQRIGGFSLGELCMSTKILTLRTHDGESR